MAKPHIYTNCIRNSGSEFWPMYGHYRKKDLQECMREVLRFAGTIDPSDLEEMRKAIDEGCEEVNLNEW